MVIRRAASQSRVYREKSQIAQYNVARRFTTSLGLVYRMSTHDQQCQNRNTCWMERHGGRILW
jgi:hypothetical protein